MNCNDVRDSLDFMLDNELEIMNLRALRSHIGDCNECRSVWQDLQNLKQKVRSYRASILTPADLRGKVRALLLDSSPPPTAGALKPKRQIKNMRIATSMDGKDYARTQESSNLSSEHSIENSRYDFIDNETDQTSANSITAELLRADILEQLPALSPRERDVVRLRFGLDDGVQRSLQEVAQLYGLTRERVRQIEAKALRKLRHPRRKGSLSDTGR